VIGNLTRSISSASINTGVSALEVFASLVAGTIVVAFTFVLASGERISDEGCFAAADGPVAFHAAVSIPSAGAGFTKFIGLGFGLDIDHIDQYQKY